MLKTLPPLFLAGLLLLPAAAQDDEDLWEEWDGGWELNWSAEAAAVIMPDADETLLYRAGAGVEATRILENLVEIGAVGHLGLQQDHPRRAGFAGVPLGYEAAGPALQGAFTGLAVGTPPPEADVRLQLEEAYVFVRGGYGEARLGRDTGVARQFHAGSPSLFTETAFSAPRLDPTGRMLVRTDHDLTGPSEKVSLRSVRILGAQAGVSYTPSADTSGLDRDPSRHLPGVPAIALEDAVEVAVQASRVLPQSGVRLKGALAWSGAEVAASPQAAPFYGNVETWSAGLSAETDTYAIGADILKSDNGGIGDYTAWSLGLTRAVGIFRIGAEYGASEDEAAGLDSEMWRIAASHELTPNSQITGGYFVQEASPNRHFTAMGPTGSLQDDGIVIEITLFH